MPSFFQAKNRVLEVVIGAAKVSLDVCIYHFYSHEIMNVIRNNVDITRIIVHNVEKNENCQNIIKELRNSPSSFLQSH